MNDRVIRESTAALENFKYDFEEFVIGYSDRLKQIRKPFAVIEYQPPMRRFRRCGPSGSPPPGSPLFHPAPPTYIIRKYGWASVILFSLLLSAAALVALYAAVPAEAPASVWGFLHMEAWNLRKSFRTARSTDLFKSVCIMSSPFPYAASFCSCTARTAKRLELVVLENSRYISGRSLFSRFVSTRDVSTLLQDIL